MSVRNRCVGQCCALGYSDYDCFFKKMIRVPVFIGVTKILRHFGKTLFKNFEPFLANWAYDLETFSSQICIWRYQNNAELCADFKTVEKNAKNSPSMCIRFRSDRHHSDGRIRNHFNEMLN
jgi:hypothetical protein